MAWSEKAKGGSSTTEGVIADYVFMDRFPFGDDEDKPKKGKKSSDDSEDDDRSCGYPQRRERCCESSVESCRDSCDRSPYSESSIG